MDFMDIFTLDGYTFFQFALYLYTTEQFFYFLGAVAPEWTRRGYTGCQS